MVVALRATHGAAEQHGSHGVREIVGDFLLLEIQVARVDLVGEIAQEAGGNERLLVVGPELIARELLLDEAVIGLVFVERIE